MRVDADHLDTMIAALGTDANVEEDDRGGAIVEMAVTNRAAFRSCVLGFLEHAEVLEPPEVRADVVAWLERAVAAGAA